MGAGEKPAYPAIFSTFSRVNSCLRVPAHDAGMKRRHPRNLTPKQAGLLPFATGIRMVLDETMAQEFHGVRFTAVDVESIGQFPGGHAVIRVTSDRGSCELVITKTGRMRIRPLDESTRKASALWFANAETSP